MPNFLKKLGWWFDRLLDALAIAAGLIFVFIMLLVCYDVMMRYIFKNPLGWTIEVCEYLLVYLTFLGSPWLLREGGHVNVDILFHYLPRVIIPVMKSLTLLIGTVALFILFIYSTQATWELYQRGIEEIKILIIPKWILFSVIPFGSLFLSIESGRQLFAQIFRFNTGLEAR